MSYIIISSKHQLLDIEKTVFKATIIVAGINNINKVKESVRIIEILDAIKKKKAYKR